MTTNLGINIVNLEIEEAVELRLERIEICLGKEDKYRDKLKEFDKMVHKAEELGLPYSIHLPVYTESWYPYDLFSAFFIDEDKNKRELSFRLLEFNLDKLKHLNSEYFVLHFPGISKTTMDRNLFTEILKESLTRVNNLAKTYGVKIYLEYFGSNKNFCDFNQWISIIQEYENLGILTDTGHLYFSSIINGFDFLDALRTLAKNSSAFHLWTTKGEKAYCECQYYKEYHHIGPHIQQKRNSGWAFDTEEVIKIIAKENKPVIIEPSIKYKGKEYLLEGIKSIKKYF